MNSYTLAAQNMTGQNKSSFKPTKIWSGLSDHVRCAFFIVMLTIIWAAAALIISEIHPDAKTGSKNAAGVYFNHIVKNNTIILYIGGILYLFKLLRSLKGVSLSERLKTVFFQDRLMLPKFFANLAVAIGTCALFTFAYSTIKTRIPEFAPYTWDVTFMKWDRALFLGHDPWTVFAFLYEIPTAIFAMDLIYDLWAPLFIGTWTVCFLVTKPSAAIRFRFPLAVLLAWFVGGNLAAIGLSSAGPCYYGLITGMADPYAAQMAILSDFSTDGFMRSTTYQAMLWDVYESPGFGFGGISAMPSMHCTTSFLFLLMAWKHKVLRIAAIAFFILILISSVVLAWHYLVDGLIGIPIAATAWWIAGRILRAITHERTEHAQA